MGRSLSASPRLADVVCGSHAPRECAVVFEVHSAAPRRFAGRFEPSRKESVSRQASAGDSSPCLRLPLHGCIDSSYDESGLDSTTARRVFSCSPLEVILTV